MRTILLAAALAMLAGAAQAQDRAFTRPYWLDRGVIEAIGRAQNETAPDRASFSVTFTETAHEAREASANAADRARLAAAAMRQRGGAGVEIRSSVSLTPIYHEYRDSGGQRQSSERADQIDNYAASVVLSVDINDTARAEDVRAAALAVGPEDVGELSYELRQTTEAQRRVYAAAVEDAAARAHAAAGAAGAHLGALLALQDGQGPCMGEWYVPQPGYADRRQYAPNAPAPAQMANEQIVVTGSRGRQLTLTAQDIERLQLPADPPRIALSAQVCAVYAIAP
jgi:uncharacterized protein